ncbi:hypothetical protein DFH08DRAFT_889101 [Mycena albidolilacea]|uniref:Uncharacterized protein n=1 Tax=Mycena albidolilacea TaxID=1033008 RepID=A0AAD7EFT2_9AGAR|nr:hypothetical protein DFH08DRAFT_889101 [Mycena albidolilacea]
MNPAADHKRGHSRRARIRIYICTQRMDRSRPPPTGRTTQFHPHELRRLSPHHAGYALAPHPSSHPAATLRPAVSHPHHIIIGFRKHHAGVTSSAPSPHSDAIRVRTARTRHHRQRSRTASSSLHDASFHCMDETTRLPTSIAQIPTAWVLPPMQAAPSSPVDATPAGTLDASLPPFTPPHRHPHLRGPQCPASPSPAPKVGLVDRPLPYFVSFLRMAVASPFTLPSHSRLRIPILGPLTFQISEHPVSSQGGYARFALATSLHFGGLSAQGSAEVARHRLS